jgi:hypothetical protein
MAIGTNVRVQGAQSKAAVEENRYLAPIAKAEGEIREREDRRKEKEARREERRQRTDAKRRKRQDRAARKIQRAYRCHRFRVQFAIFMEQRVAVTKVQARWRGILYRRRMREMLIEQIREACAIRLQAATRGGLVRLRLRRNRQARDEKTRAFQARALMKKSARQVQVAYIARVGMRPSSAKEGTAKGDYQLTEHNYDRGYSAIVIQAHVRGWLGRRRAAQEMVALQKQFEQCLRQVGAATVIQRAWRNWRRWSLMQGVRAAAVPPGYLAAANRVSQSAGGRSGLQADWEELDTGPDGLAAAVAAAEIPVAEDSELFPLFAALQPAAAASREASRQASRKASRQARTPLSSRQGGSRRKARSRASSRGSRAADEAGGADDSPEAAVERLRRMEAMQIRLIWLTPDLGPEPGEDGSRRSRNKKKTKGAGTAVVGHKETEMARHFYRKAQPLVGLRYLQAAMIAHQDSMAAAGARGKGVQAAEYAMAANSANTACMLSQPPILKFDEAKELTKRAMESLASHDDTAMLAENLSRAGLRRLEHAACEHNLALLELVSSPGQETWQHLVQARSDVDSALQDCPALTGNTHTVAVRRSYTALKKVLSAAAGVSSQLLPGSSKDEVEPSSRRGHRTSARGGGNGGDLHDASPLDAPLRRPTPSQQKAFPSRPGTRQSGVSATGFPSRPVTSVSWGGVESQFDARSLAGALDDSDASHRARITAAAAHQGMDDEDEDEDGEYYGQHRAVNQRRQRTAPHGLGSGARPDSQSVSFADSLVHPSSWGGPAAGSYGGGAGGGGATRLRAMTAPNSSDLLDAAAANANAAAAALAMAALPALDSTVEARQGSSSSSLRPPSRAVAAQLAGATRIEMPSIMPSMDGSASTVTVALSSPEMGAARAYGAKQRRRRPLPRERGGLSGSAAVSRQSSVPALLGGHSGHYLEQMHVVSSRMAT